ncbi:short chain dehydrogenase [Legionella birminghamensis]|uniref:Short chain dehydrogenase n=1 Tax=Legionella birminghamensis TaxID=28083 RepID=A0A378IB38_9GAMM|nr:short chain dehydrogenase [Legionella birminghamensis]KTC67747.1 short chain dehydrogenase [Legionella birminghamensis]STX32010.1 short chain dehydrogenase [Legionella birminghamensis]
MKRVLVIGGSGVLGRAVVEELSIRHEIIQANYSSGDIRVDITDKESIIALFRKINKIDAVVLTTGNVHFGDFAEMSDKEYEIGLRSKLMGQVNTVLIGRNHLNEQGSFTLTSGILSQDPIRYGSSASMVNGALESFTIAAAIEMPNCIRINCVSPTVITESMDAYGPFFRGYKSVSSAEAALAYSKSVEGLQTGQIYRVG